MDIFAHGLWTAAGARITNKKIKKPLSVGWSLFWGIFPDLFAFAIPMTVLIVERIFNIIPAQDFKAGGPEGNFPLSHLAYSLYNWSHSLVIFSVAFIVVYIIFKRPVLEMLGWLLHICIDIPTHVAQFYPTPLLWPLSSWKFLHGTSWGSWKFQLVNYFLILIVYLWLWKSKKNKIIQG